MPKLVELITKRLRSPSHLDGTLRFLADVPSSVPEIVLGAEDYLRHVLEEMAEAAGQPTTHQSVVNLRIGAELLVLKLSRLIAIFSAIMADLYGAEIIEMRRFGRAEDLWNERVTALGDRLRALNASWGQLAERETGNRDSEIACLLDAAPLLAEAYTIAVSLLAEMLRTEMEGTEDVEDEDND